ncbi:hypothetical protein Tco_0017414 [Tanacetum coccineum]
MAPRGRPTRLNPGTTPPPVTDPTTTTSVTSAQLQAMIDEGVTAVLAARATTRNGDDSHTSGTGVRRNERTVRECTYQDFMKCQPLFFRGTEGVVDLTQWFERMETVFRISNCIVENQVKFATCTLIRGISGKQSKQSQPFIRSYTPSQPLMGSRVECFPSGRGYRGRVRWKWVRGELESVLERWFGLETVGKGCDDIDKYEASPPDSELPA